MSLYDQFLKALEGSFDEFVRSDAVNTYLQTIGPKVTTEIIQDGIYYEFTVVSGYEEERGNWATIYNKQIRFGNEFIKLHGPDESMVITPNFFYGQNNRGEEIEYRMGLIKLKKKVKIHPILLRKTGKRIHAKMLQNLCVKQVGIAIDSKTATDIGKEEIRELKTSKQFLSTFWNIDDYLRKQNSAFYSDFDTTNSWESIEVFSSRIVDQMIDRISYKFRRDPSWIIPQSRILEKLERTSILRY
ncbi:MAG: hypothetical protein ACFFD2_15905 [Promethearchaeota archaeon]